MQVPLTEWIELLRREYAADFVPGGGAAVKIVVAPPERAAEREGAVGIGAGHAQRVDRLLVQVGQVQNLGIGQPAHAAAFGALQKPFQPLPARFTLGPKAGGSDGVGRGRDGHTSSLALMST